MEKSEKIERKKGRERKVCYGIDEMKNRLPAGNICQAFFLLCKLETLKKVFFATSFSRQVRFNERSGLINLFVLHSCEKKNTRKVKKIIKHMYQ